MAEFSPSLPSDIGTTADYSANDVVAEGGAVVGDVLQGHTSNCYFLAALAAIAIADPARVPQIVFADEPSYVVILWGQGASSRDVVRVSAELGNNSRAAIIPGGGTGPIWAALAEKAYAFHFTARATPSKPVGPYTAPQNTYASIGIGGDALNALGTLGYSAQRYTGKETGILATIRAALAASRPVCFGPGAEYNANGTIKSWYPDTGIPLIDAHVYAVAAVAADDSTITLYNPWGGQGTISALNPADGMVTLSAADFSRAVGGIAIGTAYLVDVIPGYETVSNMATIYWTGAVDGDPTNPANYSTSATEAVVPAGVNLVTDTVNVGGYVPGITNVMLNPGDYGFDSSVAPMKALIVTGTGMGAKVNLATTNEVDLIIETVTVTDAAVLALNTSTALNHVASAYILQSGGQTSLVRGDISNGEPPVTVTADGTNSQISGATAAAKAAITLTNGAIGRNLHNSLGLVSLNVDATSSVTRTVTTNATTLLDGCTGTIYGAIGGSVVVADDGTATLALVNATWNAGLPTTGGTLILNASGTTVIAGAETYIAASTKATINLRGTSVLRGAETDVEGAWAGTEVNLYDGAALTAGHYYNGATVNDYRVTARPSVATRPGSGFGFGF